MSVDMSAYNEMAHRARAPSDANGFGGSQASQESRSPLSTFNFLKNLNSEKKQTKADGQPQKRRGPKPDSKPALTRRQELNRQAQRTHRERKEQYIKALEHEVLRLKELYGNTTRERDAHAAQNVKMREMLAAHGIAFDFATPPVTGFSGMNASYDGTSSGSISGSYGQDSNSAGLSPSPMNANNRTPPQGSFASAAQIPSGRLDYDQMGIDFVLTLERPCMDHMQYLVVRSYNAEEQPQRHPMERPDDMETEHMCGHALMASCPPISHVMDKPGEPYGHKMPDLQKSDLLKLLAASARLPGMEGGEITPVKAWMQILSHPRLRYMSEQDFELVKTDLLGKVRCYGFGAVMEEFEVDDALNSVFAGKDGVATSNSMAPSVQI